MHQFPSAKHLALWAGMCPGNHESAGKQLHGTTRKGSPWLRQLLLEAAHAAAHSILVISFHLLQRHVPYQELGANFFDEHERDALQQCLVRRLEHLGYHVALQPAPPAA